MNTASTGVRARVAAAIEQRGMSGRSVARAARIDPETLRLWLDGKQTSMQLRALERLLGELGLELRVVKRRATG